MEGGEVRPNDAFFSWGIHGPKRKRECSAVFRTLHQLKHQPRNILFHCGIKLKVLFGMLKGPTVSYVSVKHRSNLPWFFNL